MENFVVSIRSKILFSLKEVKIMQKSYFYSGLLNPSVIFLVYSFMVILLFYKVFSISHAVCLAFICFIVPCIMPMSVHSLHKTKYYCDFLPC